MQCADTRKVAVRNVWLDALDANDASALARWRADPLLSHDLLRQASVGGEREALDWINTCEQEASQFTTGIRSGDSEYSQLLGVARLMFIDSQAGVAELGIYLGDANSRGCGIGRRALEQIVSYGFETIGLRKIFLRVSVNNPVAIGLYKRVGFIEEGRLREHWRDGNRYVDLICMALFKELKQ